MSIPDRRSRKRLSTRQSISDVASLLFMERGFDRVTVDEIAAAADVGRMTVFNHFPRKEDMFFDRDEEGREALREALLRRRDPDIAPIEALRLHAHRLVAEESSYIDFSAMSQKFIATVEASETLKSRARTIGEEIAQEVAVALANSVGRDTSDPDAHLAGRLLMATWTAAFIEGHRTFRRSRDARRAEAAFLALVDKGTIGVAAAMAGTPYV